MDVQLLVGIAVALLAVILSVLFYLRGKGEDKSDAAPEPAPVRVQGRPAPVRRGPGGVRNAREVRRNRVQISDDENSDEDNNAAGEEGAEGDEHAMPDFSGEKMGAKKRAKLEAKHEKKVQRENELRMREDKKKKEAIVEEERQKVEEKELEEKRRQEEAERLAKEEQERQEHEEYLKMKASFAVEEEGYEETDADKENLLQDFINYIKDNKVVVLEDLATHFKLKTQSVIDRINELKSNGTLTGVVDDRGKFIYVSEIELQSVAKFIKQRGRVSISELAESSNSLINLVPVIVQES